MVYVNQGLPCLFFRVVSSFLRESLSIDFQIGFLRF